MANVVEKATFSIRKVMEGLYAIGGIFHDEVDYFAPSPLYQKQRQHPSDSASEDQNIESQRLPDNR